MSEATLTFGSLFSGCGGFDAGLERAGMKAIWQVEIDKLCRSVLRRHWPDVVCYDDVRRVRAYLEPKNERRTAVRLERPDWLCGGFPCQDVSVAGRRAGLAGSRSGLWFTFRRIAALIRPRGLLIENVDGLRSSNGGRDLGVILRALGDMGYGWAYRVFDSQWFGLAQRRERVFIVGCLGNWRRAGEILFERDSLPWHSAPSRETGTRVAASLTRGSANGRGINAPGRRREDDVNLVGCLKSSDGGVDDNSARNGLLVARCLTAGEGKRQDGESVNLIAHTLRAEGFDASEDGTGRGTPIIPIDMRQASRGATMTNNRRAGTSGGAPGTGIGKPGDPAFTVCDSHPPAIAFDTTQITSPGNYSAPKSGEPCHPLASGQHAPTVAAFSNRGIDDDVFETVRSDCNGALPMVCQWRPMVRRLTPRECERLQGFPDDWTRWDADGSELADSPRYRMMGNAVSVPVVEWIGRRIQRSLIEEPRP